ncbi:glycosyltransferase family 4 protein [Vibrio parahaemolyticus]|uniref:glycosyltransferase family 4 protein n=1 Tax=Vibrio parahaemolyticus TaxID=670 RepID=UPI00111DF85F|nr:glycosyltransferase family 4 protein [Vibrio parahaemolyticus]EKB1972159.1 glycosyltransferase [Vibrio parahaemolyticus]MDF4591086.1 glycosyltransferase family 4 protein [Vibrio parahaemolyticus]TOB78989.1 hypothetical protein CGK00_04490 [Vibrio parahaemolyticus]
MKVLHVLYQSTPNISGSSTRSNHIIHSQREEGIEPIVITSPGQKPLDLSKRTDFEVIDSSKYYRTYMFNNLSIGGNSSISNKLKKVICFPFFLYKLWRVCSIEKPAVIHAHAMFYCAIAALIVGKLKCIPVVYEIRSLWYINSNSKQNELLKKIAIKLECFAIRTCDAIVAISDGIKNEFSMQRSDIVVVRNAIEASEDIGVIGDLKNIKKFAYIGSVIELEGLDSVIRAFSILNKKYPDLEFHVFGGGSKLEELKELAKLLNSPTVFHGEVLPSDIKSCYRDIDCIINYRNDEPISHLVTPLKPLEAVLFNKPLICSEVGGYLEILGGRDHAFFVPTNDIDALTNKIIFISDPENEEALKFRISRAKKFVLSNRVWSANVDIYKDIYSGLKKLTNASNKI